MDDPGFDDYLDDELDDTEWYLNNMPQFKDVELERDPRGLSLRQDNVPHNFLQRMTQTLDDENEEGREHREIPSHLLPAEVAGKVILQAVQGHFRRVLQRSRNILQISCCKYGEHCEHKDYRPRSCDGTRDLKRPYTEQGACCMLQKISPRFC